MKSYESFAAKWVRFAASSLLFSSDPTKTLKERGPESSTCFIGNN